MDLAAAFTRSYSQEKTHVASIVLILCRAHSWKHVIFAACRLQNTFHNTSDVSASGLASCFLCEVNVKVNERHLEVKEMHLVWKHWRFWITLTVGELSFLCHWDQNPVEITKHTERSFLWDSPWQNDKLWLGFPLAMLMMFLLLCCHINWIWIQQGPKLTPPLHADMPPPHWHARQTRTKPAHVCLHSGRL